jgi:membrane fusion protein (multidrug efflux system)
MPAFLPAAFAFTLAFLLAGCGKADSAATRAAPPPVSVAALRVEPRAVPVVLDVVGRAEGSREVEIRARVSGIVEKQLYVEGEPVKEGATLFRIERAPFDNALAEARAALAQERNKAEQAKRDSERLQPLVARRAISQREADDAVTTVRQTQAAISAAEARLRDAERNLSYTTVTAPISGVAGRAQRSEGSLATAGSDSSVLTTLTQTNPVWVRFALSEPEFATLRANAGKKADVKLLFADGSEYPAHGRLNFAASTVDARTGTVQLRAEFPNPALAILPGQFARVHVVAGVRQAIAVPQQAVFQNDQGRFVWVVGADNKALQRKVEAGSWSGTDWVIRTGLETGDQVIIDNHIRLRPGAPVQVVTPSKQATR